MRLDPIPRSYLSQTLTPEAITERENKLIGDQLESFDDKARDYSPSGVSFTE
jgi:hypothetical protein